jgi:hypothetical protein
LATLPKTIDLAVRSFIKSSISQAKPSITIFAAFGNLYPDHASKENSPEDA